LDSSVSHCTMDSATSPRLLIHRCSNHLRDASGPY
jgi:hypothetical protein